MLKKVLKYVGLVLGILTALPLVVAPFMYKVKVANIAGDPTNVKLFEDLDGFKYLVKDFNPFWINLFKVLVFVALAVAVVLLLVSLLDDLKVLKLQKVEKLLASVLAVVGVVALVVVLINQFVNSSYETTEVLGKKVTSGSGFTANLVGWLFPVFALVGGLLTSACIQEGKSSKKSKKRK